MGHKGADRVVVGLWCRQVGALLRYDVPPAAALGIVAQEIASMAEASMSLLVEVETGTSLAEAIAEMSKVFPPLVRAAALAGARAGRLGEALIEAAECLLKAAELGVEPTDERQLAELAESATVAPAVALARRLLVDAIDRDALELRVTGGAQGGVAEVQLSGAWRVLEEVDAELFGPLCRRFKLMAQIPYWITEPAVGTFRFDTPDGRPFEIAVRTIPDEAGAGQTIDMTLTPRIEPHEPA